MKSALNYLLLLSLTLVSILPTSERTSLRDNYGESPETLRLKKQSKATADLMEESLQALAFASGHSITEVTSKIDKNLSATELSAWMDKVYGTSGGWYHRVKHGHDIGSNLTAVYRRFGLAGVLRYPVELAKDFTTAHGIPLPGTQFAVNSGLVGAKFATRWLSLNAGDVITGLIAVYSTFRLGKRVSNDSMSPEKFLWATIGLSTKIVAGVTTHNPILIISGLADGIIILEGIDQFNGSFDKLARMLSSPETVSTGWAIATWYAAKLSILSLVSSFGYSSTGTAISTLSGAAATQSTLSTIGGGSIATGGLGVTGGTIIVSVGAAAIGALVGYLVYDFLSQSSETAQNSGEYISPSVEE